MLRTMLDFFTIAITMPALPFTVAVLFSTVFWLVSLVGGLDFGGEGADGVLDGVTDGVDGAVDGAADAAADAAFDGAADGIGEAADGASDTVSGLTGPALVASVLGLGKVPITVWVSLFALWGWAVAFVGGWLLRSPLIVFVPAWPANTVVLLIATVAGVVLARLTSRPLEPVYRSHGGRKRASLVGEVAEITTSRVDAKFGQARIEIGGDDLVVQVRCDGANPLVRGSRALVVEFDSGRDAFVVEPLEKSNQKSTIQDVARSRTGARITDQGV